MSNSRDPEDQEREEQPEDEEERLYGHDDGEYEEGLWPLPYYGLDVGEVIGDFFRGLFG